MVKGAIEAKVCCRSHGQPCVGVAQATHQRQQRLELFAGRAHGASACRTLRSCASMPAVAPQITCSP